MFKDAGQKFAFAWWLLLACALGGLAGFAWVGLPWLLRLVWP